MWVCTRRTLFHGSLPPDLAGARCNLQVRDTINFMNVCSEEAIFSFFFSLFLFSRDLFTFLLSF